MTLRLTSGNDNINFVSILRICKTNYVFRSIAYRFHTIDAGTNLAKRCCHLELITFFTFNNNVIYTFNCMMYIIALTQNLVNTITNAILWTFLTNSILRILILLASSSIITRFTVNIVKTYFTLRNYAIWTTFNIMKWAWTLKLVKAITIVIS